MHWVIWIGIHWESLAWRKLVSANVSMVMGGSTTDEVIFRQHE